MANGHVVWIPLSRRRSSIRRPRGEYAVSAPRRRHILTTAIEVFRRHGFRGSSLRQIAEEAGVSHGTLLYHFGSKDGLILEVLQLNEAGDRLSLQVVEDDAAAVLAVLINHFANQHQYRTELYVSIMGEAIQDDHPGHTYMVRRYEFLIEFLEQCLCRLASDGRLHPGTDPSSASRAIVALMDGLQVQWLYGGRETDIADDLQTMLKLIVTPQTWETSVEPRIDRQPVSVEQVLD